MASAVTTARAARARHHERSIWRSSPGIARLLLLALIGLAPAWCAAQPIEISAAVGFADLFRPGHWTPVNVSVVNRGADLRAEIEVAVTADDPALKRPTVSYHRRQMDLPRDARKRVQFTVLPQGLAHPVTIRVRAGGRELAASEIDLRSRFAAERLLVVLSRRIDLDYLSDGAVDGLRVLHPHPELLPVHWRGYDAVAAVIVHGVTLEHLSPAQHEALRKWIAQGGILAVCGGADPAVLKSPRLTALLPVVAAGTTTLDPATLRQAFPSLDPTRALSVHRASVVQGEARLRAADTVLIAERAFGRGRVLYLGFDVSAPPFDRWEGMRSLWLDALRLPPPASSAAAVSTQGAGALAALLRAEATDFPGNSTAFLFLILYLGVLLAAQLLPSSLRGAGALATLRTWGPPLAFAPLAWLLFGPAAFPRGATAASVALIEPIARSDYARVELELGLYATRGGPMTFEYGGTDPVLVPAREVRAANGRPHDWVFGDGERRYIEPLERRRYFVQALEGVDVIAFRLRASAEMRGTTLRLKVDNADARGLEDAWLVFAGHTFALGDIDPGMRFERDFALPAQPERGEAYWRHVPKPPAGVPSHLTQAAQVLLERRARGAGEQGYPRAGHALLLGYARSPLEARGASRDWPRHERALVAYELEAIGGAVDVGPASPQSRGLHDAAHRIARSAARMRTVATLQVSARAS